MAVFEEFWIVSWSGPTLFFYSQEKQFDPNLIGGFFSAIQMFAKKMSHESGLNSLSLGKHTFTFVNNEKFKLYFISKSTKKVKTKQILKKIEAVEKAFIDRYETELKTMEIDYSGFEEFTEEFEKIFKDYLSRLEGMW